MGCVFSFRSGGYRDALGRNHGGSRTVPGCAAQVALNRNEPVAAGRHCVCFGVFSAVFARRLRQELHPILGRHPAICGWTARIKFPVPLGLGHPNSLEDHPKTHPVPYPAHWRTLATGGTSGKTAHPRRGFGRSFGRLVGNRGPQRRRTLLQPALSRAVIGSPALGGTAQRRRRDHRTAPRPTSGPHPPTPGFGAVARAHFYDSRHLRHPFGHGGSG